MRNFIVMAFRNIMASRKRTILLMISLGLTAALYFVMMNTAASLDRRAYDVATLLYSGQVNVVGIRKKRMNKAEVTLRDLERVREVVKAVVPEAEIFERQLASVQIIGPKSSQSIFLIGLQPKKETELVQALGVRSGLDDGLILFRDQARKLGVEAGDVVTVMMEQHEGSRNALEIKVAAIAEDRGLMSQLFAYTDMGQVENLTLRHPETSGFLGLRLHDRTQAPVVRDRLLKAFKAANLDTLESSGGPQWNKTRAYSQDDWVGSRIAVTTWSDEVKPLAWISQLLRFLTLGFIGLLALLIGFGLSNAVWLLVKQRTREIGTLRAMGFSRFHVIGIFMTETQILAFVSSISACGFCFALLFGLNALHLPLHNQGLQMFVMAQHYSVDPSWDVFFQTVIMSSLLTAMGTLFPALGASKLPPTVALSK